MNMWIALIGLTDYDFFFKKKVEYMNFPGRFVLLGSLIWKGKIEGYIDIDKYVDVYLYIEINT